MSRSRFGWNSKRGKQEQAFRWLRRKIKEESILMLSDPGAFHKKYPPPVVPAVAVMQEVIQKYIDAGDLEGPPERYFTVTTGRKFSTYIATVDIRQLEEYFVQNQETLEKYPLRMLYGVPVVHLNEDAKPSLLSTVCEHLELWKLGGPGVIFEGPVVEVTF